MKKTLLLLILGFALGLVASRGWQGSAALTLPSETASTSNTNQNGSEREALRGKLSALTEKEMKEYFELKNLKARYEKADELLGKMMLVLLADVGFRISDRNRMEFEKMAGEKSSHDKNARAALTAQSPSQAGTKANPAVENTTPTTTATEPEPAPRETLRSNPGTAPSAGGVSLFDGFKNKNPRNCHKDPLGWYISGENPKDYAVNSTNDNQASIESLHTRVRPESVELNHCSELQTKPGQRVIMTAEIKADKVLDYANVHIKARTSEQQNIQLAKKSFTGTFDWKTSTVELVIPEGTDTLLYGITFESQGKAWIRNVRFTIGQ